MKRYISIFMIVILSVFITGCGSSGSCGSAVSEQDSAVAEDVSGDSKAEETGNTADDDTAIDVDLSALSSTMVYAQVYDMMTKPDEFIGKTVKATGTFAVYTDDSTGKNYYACIIQDATACCQQGLEFELKGEHAYPDDYPEIGSDVTVTGTFDTYEENGAMYCTLRESVLA